MKFCAPNSSQEPIFFDLIEKKFMEYTFNLPLKNIQREQLNFLLNYYVN
jgi:hypothetical protein